MLPNLSPIQWVVLIGVIALVIVPRLGTLKTPLGSLVGLLRRGPTSPDIHAKVEAYQTLADDLSPELAQKVWVSIQSSTLADPEVPHAN